MRSTSCHKWLLKETAKFTFLILLCHLNLELLLVISLKLRRKTLVISLVEVDVVAAVSHKSELCALWVIITHALEWWSSPIREELTIRGLAQEDWLVFISFLSFSCIRAVSLNYKWSVI